MPRSTKGNAKEVVKAEINKKLSQSESNKLLEILQNRFEQNSVRHDGLKWADVKSKLEINSKKLLFLSNMEATGGEPDVVGFDEETGEYIFFDCSPESPKGRRSFCYDNAALEARKKFPPVDSAQNIGVIDKMR